MDSSALIDYFSLIRLKHYLIKIPQNIQYIGIIKMTDSKRDALLVIHRKQKQLNSSTLLLFIYLFIIYYLPHLNTFPSLACVCSLLGIRGYSGLALCVHCGFFFYLFFLPFSYFKYFTI